MTVRPDSTPPKPRRTEADPGYQICPECKGLSHCFYCEGAGTWDGAPCPECFGRGTCLVCDGGGQVPLPIQ